MDVLKINGDDDDDEMNDQTNEWILSPWSYKLETNSHDVVNFQFDVVTWIYYHIRHRISLIADVGCKTNDDICWRHEHRSMFVMQQIREILKVNILLYIQAKTNASMLTRLHLLVMMVQYNNLVWNSIFEIIRFETNRKKGILMLGTNKDLMPIILTRGQVSLV